jgi:uncharacterized FlgJ-related protein
LFILASTSVFAQTEKVKTSASKEYVFEIPYMDLTKQMSSFKADLKAIPNLEFYGFCESRKLLMIRMPESSLEQFKNLLGEKDYLYYQKIEGTFMSAEKDCNAKEEIKFSRSIN